MTSPLDAVEWPVRSERLLLRRFVADDVPAIFAIRSQPQVSEWIGGAVTDETVLAERFGDGPTAVVVEHDGHVIGDLMVVVGDAWAQHEVKDSATGSQAVLGWCFEPASGGQGLATEAVSEIIRICFEDLGLRRVVAECFSGNEPSWRLMERIGMRREAHHVKDSLHRDLGWQDGYVYALLAEERRDS